MPRRARSAQRGFTLLEVMIALAILAGGLMILLSASSMNVERTKRAQWLAVATDLARGKMYDLEEELLKDGFQELDKTESGEFDDEGWPQIEWEAKVEKIELPSLGALQEGQAEGEEGAEGGAGGGLLGGFLGTAGGADPSTNAGAGLIASQFQLVADVLEKSIRKVTLTVKWTVNGDEQELVVNCYFTDPKAVNQTFGGGGAAPADDGTGEAGGSGGGAGGGSTTGSGGRGGSTSPTTNSRGGSSGSSRGGKN